MNLALHGAGVVLGIVLLGLWGDVVIGTLLTGAARLVTTMTEPVSRVWRGGRHALSSRARPTLARLGSSSEPAARQADGRTTPRSA